MGLYVITTRYQAPGSTVVIRHAYGPFPTRSKALTALKHFEPPTAGQERHVVKVLEP